MVRSYASLAFLRNPLIDAKMQPLLKVTVSMELFDIKEVVSQVYLRLSFES